jgi:ComF family protein
MPCQLHNNYPVYIWLNNDQSCLLCDGATASAKTICEGCEADLPWLTNYCERCALPMPLSNLTCSQCTINPPAFEEVVAAWHYDFPIDSLVTRFKHQGKWPLGRLLAELFNEFLRYRFNEGLTPPDFLLPVPMASKRLRQRGYNQAAMLADWLGAALTIPVQQRLMKRVKETPAQQGLDAKARRRNLLDAFELLTPHTVIGKHIAVVDDVLTTGSTADVIARLLRKAGARQVDVYCLARTAKPSGPL